jgi:hypothetical protein
MRAYGLLSLVIIYGLASFLHHIHNAVFLNDYPNMPAWLSTAGVYAAWLGVAAVGLSGYLLYRRGHQLVGLAVIAVYGALGLDGLAHYSRAPFSAHTFTMNLTIWLEVVTAVVLLIAVAGLMAMRLRRAPASL